MTLDEIYDDKAEFSRAEYINDRELSDLKAKYIKEGYESCLREVKARVGSLKKYTPQGGNMPDTYFSEGHNDCLDEIKSLINEL